MEYFKVDARFHFFNGKTSYTVEYTTSLNKWYIFNDRSQSGSVYQKEQKRHLKNISWDTAEDVLIEYLNIKNQ